MDTIKKYPFLTLFFAIIITSSLLRSTIVAVGPISEIIIGDLNISATSFGLITTIPLIVFALSSVAIPFIASKNGLINTLIGGLLLIISGSFLRAVGSYDVLLIGTILLGFGISISNVLIPAIIKEYARGHRAVFTSSYLCMQNMMASIASGIAFYVAVQFSWTFLMAIWIVPAFIAVALWIRYKSVTRKIINESTDNLTFVALPIIKELLKSKYAWALSIIMALQSILYYTSVTWLPAIAIDNGFSQEFVSFLMISFQLIPLPGLFLVPIILKKMKYDSYIILIAGIIITGGILAFILTSSANIFYVATLLLSLGAGMCFAWVVATITNKTRDGQQASGLSAMSQTIGYSLAAIGPWIGGLLVDISGNPKTIIIFMLISGSLILLTSIYIYFKRNDFSFE